MKHNHSLYILLILFLTIPSLSFAQVGIGNLKPDTTSVLDLSNTADKGLLLPNVDLLSQAYSTEGMLYFINPDLYLKLSNNFNSISAWKFKFNGNTTNNLYYNLGGNIGIGVSDIYSTPQAPLQIETLNPVDLTQNGTLLLGKSNATNIAINNAEIQSRDIASASELKINEDGGDITIGKNTSRNDIIVNGNLKELHHPTNEYGDIVPSGLIIMWYGDTVNIPNGWALCNGMIYPKAKGSGSLQSPDLRGKFVVAAGNNGTTDYYPNDEGGQDSVTLTANELPYHSHNVRDQGHYHSYTDRNSPTQIAGYLKCAVFCPSPNKDELTYSDKSSSTSTAINPMTEDFKGGDKPHENRPKYYTLVYIMKL